MIIYRNIVRLQQQVAAKRKKHVISLLPLKITLITTFICNWSSLGLYVAGATFSSYDTRMLFHDGSIIFIGAGGFGSIYFSWYMRPINQHYAMTQTKTADTTVDEDKNLEKTKVPARDSITTVIQ